MKERSWLAEFNLERKKNWNEVWKPFFTNNKVYVAAMLAWLVFGLLGFQKLEQVLDIHIHERLLSLIMIGGGVVISTINKWVKTK